MYLATDRIAAARVAGCSTARQIAEFVAADKCRIPLPVAAVSLALRRERERSAAVAV